MSGGNASGTHPQDTWQNDRDALLLHVDGVVDLDALLLHIDGVVASTELYLQVRGNFSLVT
jgi:hypothetical protein